MPRQLSPEAFRQLFAQESTDVFLLCLTISHANLPAPIRVVKNNADLIRNAGTFLKCTFDIQLAEDAADAPPQVQLVIDNVDKAISTSLMTLQGKVSILLEVVLGSQPDTVEISQSFFLLNSSFNAKVVTGTLGYEEEILNQSFPKDTYAPGNTPGLWR